MSDTVIGTCETCGRDTYEDEDSGLLFCEGCDFVEDECACDWH